MLHYANDVLSKLKQLEGSIEWTKNSVAEAENQIATIKAELERMSIDQCFINPDNLNVKLSCEAMIEGDTDSSLPMDSETTSPIMNDLVTDMEKTGIAETVMEDHLPDITNVSSPGASMQDVESGNGDLGQQLGSLMNSAMLCLSWHQLKSYERVYCTVCNRTLANKYSFRTHMRTHTGERPFACHLCSAKFTTKGTLKTHVTRQVCAKRNMNQVTKASAIKL